MPKYDHHPYNISLLQDRVIRSRSKLVYTRAADNRDRPGRLSRMYGYPTYLPNPLEMNNRVHCLETSRASLSRVNGTFVCRPLLPRYHLNNCSLKNGFAGA
jgi:hypothetical protein